MPLEKYKLNLPFKLGEFVFAPNDVEKRAAWKLYVELVTRVATRELAENAGTDREALDSLYSIFAVTRRILRRAGPTAGLKQGTVGRVALDVLNEGLRPFLTKWHTGLTAFEASAQKGVPWPERKQFRSELAKLSVELSRYAEILTILAEVGDQT
jgi:hypothetical protein